MFIVCLHPFWPEGYFKNSQMNISYINLNVTCTGTATWWRISSWQPCLFTGRSDTRVGRLLLSFPISQDIYGSLSLCIWSFIDNYHHVVTNYDVLKPKVGFGSSDMSSKNVCIHGEVFLLSQIAQLVKWQWWRSIFVWSCVQSQL